MHPHSRRRRAATRGRVAWLALLLGCLACAEAATEAPWPEGAVFSGRTDALRDLLADLQALEGTPLARAARALGARLPDCPQLESHASDGQIGTLFASLACAGSSDRLHTLHAARGGDDLLLALPMPTAARLQVRGRVTADDIALTLHWPEAPGEGALALLLPGEAPVGAALLPDAERLMHLRVRPQGGLDLASLIPPRSQADRLFRMRSEIFSAAALAGTWELGIYLPTPEQRMPRAVLALEFRLRSAAIGAMERFVAELETTWRVRRSRFSHGDASGACLPELRVLPELEPCYAATDRALLIGWNAASLVHALSGGPRVDPAPSPSAGLSSLEIARFAEADTLLSRHLGADFEARSAALPWRRLTAHGGRQGGALDLRIAISRGAGP